MIRRLIGTASAFLAAALCFIAEPVLAQDSVLINANLQQVVAYSLAHQTRVKQSLLDEEIVKYNVRARLADWYPQLNVVYNAQHNFILPSSLIAGNVIRLGAENTSSAQFLLSQNLFNRDVVLASGTRSEVLRQASLNTELARIDAVVNVSKAYYDVLATEQQIKVADENIARSERSLQDARNMFDAGITDKTDYKRATISLNNVKATRAGAFASLSGKYAALKALMGYPVNAPLSLAYDSLAMEAAAEARLDVLPQTENRVEYQALQVQRSLLQSNLQYAKFSYLPNASLNGAYNFNYQNNNPNLLYTNNYPASYAALTVSLPIFQGGKRTANIRAARTQLLRNDEDLRNMELTVNREYEQSKAAYIANFANYEALKQNVLLAEEVHDVIRLQYRSGIKTYLELITAETELRTAQINYFNALYYVLAAKLDMQRALGMVEF